ncbi:MAG: CvpA family protein [Bacilli bacterium]|nr:CvpA family protein [Bacilli bacterium]
MGNLNIVDFIILLVILLGGLIGFKEGAIKKTASIVGLVLVVVLSFILKNYLSVIFYENLPFFNLWGMFKGIQVVNIVFYELVAFLLVSAVLSIAYRVILTITGIVEKVLKATIILSIPSKIIGGIIGILENYIWVYLFLFIFTLPFMRINDLYESKISMFILKETPILSKYTNKTVDIYSDLYNIIDNKEGKSNEKVNEEAMDLMLKYEIITVESADKLIRMKKVDINDKSFIDKYR